MIRTSEEFRKLFRSARNVATPLIAVRTADPASAISQALRAADVDLTESTCETPVAAYDLVTGIRGRNDYGNMAVAKLLGDGQPQMAPGDALHLIAGIDEHAIVFFLNPQRFWEQPDVVQGIWNLRDQFKGIRRTLVLVTTPGATLPVELQSDVMIIDQPLPSIDDIESMIPALHESAGLPVPPKETGSQIVDALIGLAAFPQEQALALSLKKKGVDMPQLWERKRQAINQVRGLSIHSGVDTFDAIGGCTIAKEYFTDLLNGREAARVCVFVDEIEKAFAGTGTDTSGIKTDMTGTLLTWMQETEADGMLLLGHPGCTKSAIAKAVGPTFGRPTIICDFSGLQSGIIGSSGEFLRTALQVIQSISQGRSLWIGTCNSMANLPPELKRRFEAGTFFFDLPTSKERDMIWKIYEAKWKLKGPRPVDTDWTGAEIRKCCYRAWRLNIPLMKSATYIIPLALSDSESVARLRQQAAGKYLSASYPGAYQLPKLNQSVAPKRAMRAVGE